MLGVELPLLKLSKMPEIRRSVKTTDARKVGVMLQRLARQVPRPRERHHGKNLPGRPLGAWCAAAERRDSTGCSSRLWLGG